MTASPTLPPALVQQLLQLLSSDDLFRSSFASNPGDALVGLGADASFGVLCCGPLPSLGTKDEFAQAALQLAERLEVQGPFNVPFLFLSGLPGLNG